MAADSEAGVTIAAAALAEEDSSPERPGVRRESDRGPVDLTTDVIAGVLVGDAPVVPVVPPVPVPDVETAPVMTVRGGRLPREHVMPSINTALRWILTAHGMNRKGEVNGIEIVDVFYPSRSVHQVTYTGTRNRYYWSAANPTTNMRYLRMNINVSTIMSMYGQPPVRICEKPSFTCGAIHHMDPSVFLLQVPIGTHVMRKHVHDDGYSVLLVV